MKKNKLFMIIFLFVGLFIFGIDNVLADDGKFYIYYTGCDSIKSDTAHPVEIGKKTATEKCNGSGSWKVIVYQPNDSVKWKIYCNHDNKKELMNGNPQPYSGQNIDDYLRNVTCPDNYNFSEYKNGATVSETGNNGDRVYFYWIGSNSNNGSSNSSNNGSNNSSNSGSNNSSNSGSNNGSNNSSNNGSNNGSNNSSRNGSNNGSNSSILNNKISCGKLGSFNKKIPEITSWIVTIVEILVPILLVIFGSIDFVKAVVAQKEDEIKKGQQTFIKRLIVAVLIFFVTVITRLVVSLVSGSDGEKESILSCIDCFISYKCN